MTVDYRVGDTRSVVATIADGSADLVATSPPFLALRSYVPADHASKGDEIGSESNPAAFIDTLLGLTAEWGRVLAPHGSIAIELGDTYSGSGGAGGDYNAGGLRDGQERFDGSQSRAFGVGAAARPARGGRASMVENAPGNHTGGLGWPFAKSLALIPQLYAVALAYGINPLTGQPSPAGRWLVRNVIVWHRPNPAVGALGDKVRPSTSYIVIATRSAKRWFDLTAVRHAPANGLSPGTSVSNGLYRGHPDELSSTARPNVVANVAGAPPLDAWFDEYDGSHDTWTLTTQPSKLAHYAMWPAKFAERLILMMCPSEVCRACGEPRRRIEITTNAVGKRPPVSATAKKHQLPDALVHIDLNGGPDCSERETLGWTDCGHDDYRPGHVLDPFAGTGTTLAVADLHGRDTTGIDFDSRNHDIYAARYDECKRALFGTMPELAGQLDMFQQPA